MSVGVAENYGQRSTCGMSLKDSADNLRLIRLNPRCRTLSPAFTSEYIVLEILLRELQTGWDTVQNHSYQLTM